MKYYFSENDLGEYLMKLKQLRMGKEESVEEFMQRFNETVTKVNACMKLKECLRESEKYGCFISSLPKDFQNKIIDTGKKNIWEAVEHIKAIQELTKQLKILDIGKADTKYDELSRVKLCKTHGKGRHDTNECWSMRKKFTKYEEKNFNDKKKTNDNNNNTKNNL